MSKKRYYISLICLLMLCTTIYGVEIVTTTHVFDEMYKQGQMNVTDQNKLATTETLTYTCANGAKFYADPYKTYGKISIFMDKSSATVTTSQVDNLKEIDIYHYPQEDLSSKIVVSISTDGKKWEELQLINQVSVYVRATMPATGDYYVRIEQRSGQDYFYIHQITYYTEKCACFPYIKPE
ncbi:MAG: hypothetical protein U0L62_00055 [Paludibacteraceae bacterium]|nr:hypothetical protein [Paludibacteraceae bacterium]